MKKASIIVITYNEEKNIDECIQSLLHQDYEDYELLVVDASEDQTATRASLYPRVRVIKSEKKGFGIQRNLGVKHATGHYIAFTDADCIAPPTWLKNAITFLENNNLSGTGGNAYPPENSPLIGKAISCLGYPAGGALGLSPNDLFSTCNAVLLKSALEEANGFNEYLLHGGEDTDLSARLKEKGHTLLINQESYVYHKTRTFSEFLSWCQRRGRAKYHLTQHPKQLLMPLAVLAYPLTAKYRKIFKKRKHLQLPYSTILFLVPTLFFLRQLFMTCGWIQEALHQNQSQS
ncbi:MAG TPA: glycosyltransferase [Candidatus Nanoarchaeia archaeon]|nr:glycosyltransferase [Candidatus Nanoarchaeia archaeon]